MRPNFANFWRFLTISPYVYTASVRRTPELHQNYILRISIVFRLSRRMFIRLRFEELRNFTKITYCEISDGFLTILQYVYTASVRRTPELHQNYILRISIVFRLSRCMCIRLRFEEPQNFIKITFCEFNCISTPRVERHGVFAVHSTEQEAKVNRKRRRIDTRGFFDRFCRWCRNTV